MALPVKISFASPDYNYMNTTDLLAIISVPMPLITMRSGCGLYPNLLGEVRHTHMKNEPTVNYWMRENRW